MAAWSQVLEENIRSTAECGMQEAHPRADSKQREGDTGRIQGRSSSHLRPSDLLPLPLPFSNP